MSEEAIPIKEQLGLWGGSEVVNAPKQDTYPPEIVDAINTVMGCMPGNEPPHSDARAEFLKKTDKTKKKTYAEDVHVKTLDLADPKQQAEYEKIILEVCNPDKGYHFSETPAAPMLDPNSALGYRVIVILKWYKLREVVEIIKKDVTEVSYANQMARLGA